MIDANELSTANRNAVCACLVGAGTVGRSILHDHLAHQIDVLLVDVNADMIALASREVVTRHPRVAVEANAFWVGGLPSVRFTCAGRAVAPTIVIESVSENLSLKQSLFGSLRKTFGDKMILTTNTSNLRIADIFASQVNDANVCGLHFFMPVEQRPLVECVPTMATSQATRNACHQHAARLHKAALPVSDSPGFVVNRMLAPYLNQSLTFLEQSVAPEQISIAALRFGMPMSPLRLIDTIGLRTAFDSGRVFWQSFPGRLDPSPILPGMVKWMKKDPGGEGFYTSKSSDAAISETASRVVATYRRGESSWSLDQVTALLAIPMWIEAAEVLRARIVDDLDAIELAMRCGLGYSRPSGFFDFFDSLGTVALLKHFRVHSTSFRSMAASDDLLACLQSAKDATSALVAYRDMSRLK